MSTATLPRPRIRPTSRLMTAGELAAMPAELDGHAVKYELYDGELIVMAPPGGEHGRKQAVITRLLMNHAEERGLGVTFSEAGIVLRRNPDRVVGADAAFVLKQSLPVQYSREGYLITVPELVVEIQSNKDSDAELRSKCQEYFEAGVREIWRIDPQSKTVIVACADGRETTLGLTETLITEQLPGFAISVAMLFA